MRLFALLLTALLTACGALSSAGVPTTSYVTKFCVEIHPGDSAATSAAGLSDIANNLHATCVRVDYDPPSALNNNNGYDYSWVSTAVADGLKFYFITPYVDKSVLVANGFNAAYIAQYASVVSGLSAYAGSILAVDIINEPDNDTALNQGQLTEAQYMQLVQVVSPAIHSADPNAAIVADATAVNTTWFLGLRPVYPLLSYLAPHPYGTSASSMWATLKSLQNQTGLPVIVGEWGQSPQVPASLTTLVSQLAGNVPIVNVYEYSNQPGETTNYGILGTPAYSAYAGAILGK